MDVRVVDGKRFLVRIRAGHTLATPVTGSQPLRLGSRLPPLLLDSCARCAGPWLQTLILCRAASTLRQSMNDG